MAESILRITDGTTTISLLEIPGLLLDSWTPSIPTYKGGGTYQSSPLSTGRQLVNKQFENITETFIFKVQDVNANSLICRMQEIRRLLEKASSYWSTDWQNEPVWIEARAKCEDNIRYGLIVTGLIPEDDNPYEQPFMQPRDESVMDNMTLIIEHHLWTENQPGTGTAVAISAVETYDGRNLGNVDSTGTRDPVTTDDVYIANKRNVANLSDIWVFDASGPAFIGNLMDAVLPYGLYPVPAVGDIIYFGIDTTLANSGPFASLVFDIQTAIVQVTTIIWEYWNGAWVALTVQDNTNADGAMTGVAFDTTGVKSVHWEQPVDWTTVAVNAITAYWVRARVTVIGGAPTAPIQQNRDIYSIVWPYTEIQETAVGGDIASLARTLLTNQATGGPPNLSPARALVGLRSLSRGSNYTAYVNLSDEQNPTGITITPGGGTTVFVTNVRGPTGRNVRYSPAGVDLLSTRIEISFSTANIAQEYIGKFHVFMRVSQTGGSAEDFQIQLRWDSFGVLSSDLITVNDTGEFELLDFGAVTLPFSPPLETGDRIGTIFLDVLMSNSNAAPGTLDLYDIIMLPVDEWAIDCASTTGAVLTVAFRNSLDIDSVLSHKINIRSQVRFTDGTILSAWQAITSGEAIIQANANQRLWFFTLEKVAGNFLGPPEMVQSIQEERNQQYLSMRGNR